MAKNKFYKETLKWIDKQLDQVHKASIIVGEKLLEEENPEIIELLDQKLSHLEKQVSFLNTKFEYEKRNNDN
jgi:hypothetical protein